MELRKGEWVGEATSCMRIGKLDDWIFMFIFINLSLGVKVADGRVGEG